MEYYDSIMDDKNIKFGPIVFKTNRNKNAVLTCPAIWAFQSEITQILENIDHQSILQGVYVERFYNSVLEDLVSAMLLYFENRLKVLLVKNDVGKMNGLSDIIQIYKKAGIDIKSFQIDTDFLKEIDILRGKKHHTSERYMPQETNNEQCIDIKHITQIIEKFKNTIRIFDKELFNQYPDFEAKKYEDDYSVTVSFTTINHAYDMTNNCKIVEKQKVIKTKPDPSNISFFEIKANFSEKRPRDPKNYLDLPTQWQYSKTIFDENLRKK